MKYEYMINKRGKYVVPWAKSEDDRERRDRCFIDKFGVRPVIVSPDFWEYLLVENDVKVIEVECG
tara:strand:- start:1560 stop:1754 length:195 start_codon:yes stop_codon:yes gene_type:complete